MSRTVHHFRVIKNPPTYVRGLVRGPRMEGEKTVGVRREFGRWKREGGQERSPSFKEETLRGRYIKDVP